MKAKIKTWSEINNNEDINRPSIHLTINKNRIKQYSDPIWDIPVVYMNDNQTFEIELFNPTTKVLLAKLTLNGGQTFSNGLVVKPGERIFLERHLDNNYKFKFSTYNVDSDNEQVDKAIKYNGLISIEWFEELASQQNFYNPYSWPNSVKTGYNPNIYTTYTTSTTPTGELSSASCVYANLSSTKETGRIEYGSVSTQEFEYTNKRFSSTCQYKTSIKILPKSEQNLNSKDLRVRQYCSYCGKKVKHTFKFCPNCGKEL